MNPVLVAFFGALGATLGELVGYLAGRMSTDISPKLKTFLDKVASKIHNDAILVFILAVLPLPLFDLVGIYSGGTRMNILKFFLACFLGKFIKMLVYTRIYEILDWLKGKGYFIKMD